MAKKKLIISNNEIQHKMDTEDVFRMTKEKLDLMQERQELAEKVNELRKKGYNLTLKNQQDTKGC